MGNLCYSVSKNKNNNNDNENKRKSSINSNSQIYRKYYNNDHNFTNNNNNNIHTNADSEKITFNSNIINPKIQKFTKNTIIENESNKTIKKQIGTIKNFSIKISNITNCIIIILDSSFSVEITNSKNSNFLIAPVQTNIKILNSSNINILSISQSLNIINTNYSNFFIFVNHNPSIENCENLNFHNFFIFYMELPSLFKQNKINIWNNKWFNFNINENDNINYLNDDNIKNQVIENFKNNFDDCYISIDNYQYFPNVFGKSFNYKEKYNSLIIIKNNNEIINENEILNLFNSDEYNELDIKLINTMVIDKKSDKYLNFFLETIKNNNNNNKIYNIDYYFNDNINVKKNNNNDLKVNESNFSQQSYLITSHNFSNNIKFINENEILFLWICHENDENINNDNIKELIENYFDLNNYGYITKEDLNKNNEEFILFLEKLFDFLL